MRRCPRGAAWHPGALSLPAHPAPRAGSPSRPTHSPAQLPSQAPPTWAAGMRAPRSARGRGRARAHPGRPGRAARLGPGCSWRGWRPATRLGFLPNRKNAALPAPTPPPRGQRRPREPAGEPRRRRPARAARPPRGRGCGSNGGRTLTHSQLPRGRETKTRTEPGKRRCAHASPRGGAGGRRAHPGSHPAARAPGLPRGRARARPAHCTDGQTEAGPRGAPAAGSHREAHTGPRIHPDKHTSRSLAPPLPAPGQPPAGAGEGGGRVLGLQPSPGDRPTRHWCPVPLLPTRGWRLGWDQGPGPPWAP